MKRLLLLISVTMFVHLSFAQTPPTPPTPPSASHASHEQKVSIQLERDMKLKLAINDEQFKLNLVFPKEYIAASQEVFLAHLDKSNNGRYEWNAMGEHAKIELRKNKLKVFFKKGKITSSEKKSIKAFTEDMLRLLDWDVEDLGLWDYEGDWSLNKTN